MTDEYWTLLQEGSDEYIVQKSRFLCDAKPVRTEEEALDIIEDGLEYINDLCDNW